MWWWWFKLFQQHLIWKIFFEYKFLYHTLFITFFLLYWFYLIFAPSSWSSFFSSLSSSGNCIEITKYVNTKCDNHFMNSGGQQTREIEKKDWLNIQTTRISNTDHHQQPEKKWNNKPKEKLVKCYEKKAVKKKMLQQQVRMCGQ